MMDIDIFQIVNISHDENIDTWKLSPSDLSIKQQSYYQLPAAS